MATRTALIRQTVLSLCISMSYFGIGLVRGYSSSAIPSIKELNPDLIPNDDIASWASSVPPFGAIFGSLIAGPLLHSIGRKRTVLIVGPLWIISWCIIATTPNWPVMVCGRLLSGVGAGLTVPAAQIYVTECSDPKIRGVIGSFPAILMSGGVLVSYILGCFLSWDFLAWSSVLYAMVLVVLIGFLPESPVWYKSKNKFKEASKSYKWLHIKENPLKEQFQTTNTVELSSNNDVNNKTSNRSVYLTRPVVCSLGIGLMLLALQQLSGIDAIIFFTVDIFRASGSSVDGNLASVIIGIVQLVSNILSLFVVDKFGRKPLLIVSGLIMCISTASMGVAFYLNDIGNHDFGYLPLLSLIIFMIGFSIGFGCIPFLLMGEIFPTEQRSALSSIAGSFNLGVMFIVIKTYHPLQDAITTAATFWIYSGLCAFAVFFVIMFVPETKGLDLESISKLFGKSSDRIDVEESKTKIETISKNENETTKL